MGNAGHGAMIKRTLQRALVKLKENGATRLREIIFVETSLIVAMAKNSNAFQLVILLVSNSDKVKYLKSCKNTLIRSFLFRSKGYVLLFLFFATYIRHKFYKYSSIKII